MNYLTVIIRKTMPNAVCLIISFLACYSFFFFTSAFASAPDTTEKVSLHLRWHHQFQFAGYYAAIEKGFYADDS